MTVRQALLVGHHPPATHPPPRRMDHQGAAVTNISDAAQALLVAFDETQLAEMHAAALDGKETPCA